MSGPAPYRHLSSSAGSSTSPNKLSNSNNSTSSGGGGGGGGDSRRLSVSSASGDKERSLSPVRSVGDEITRSRSGSGTSDTSSTGKKK